MWVHTILTFYAGDLWTLFLWLFVYVQNHITDMILCLNYYVYLCLLVTPRPSTANRPPTSALSARGSHPVWRACVNFSKCSKSLFTDPANTTRPFSVFWPQSHGIANHFPISHPSFHYSSSSTINSEVLNGCVTEKVSQLWWHR